MRRLLGIVLLTGCTATAVAEPGGETGVTREAIVGGSSSTASQDAAVMIVTNGQFGCTGTLITPNLVLTARHCVAGDIDETHECGPVKNDLPATAFAIAVGVNANERNKVARGARLFVPSSKSLCGFDVALIQLDRDVPNAKTARVRFDPPKTGESTVAVGYGSATPDGPPTPGRRQRTARVEGVGPATKTWKPKSGQSIEYDIPAGDLATGESTCFGDSGGPLFDSAGAVVGVTSRGIDGECSDRPSIYAGTTAHEKLIRGAASSAGHPLADAPPAEGDDLEPQEGDPEDDAPAGDEDDEGTTTPRRTSSALRPQPSSGCAASPSGAGGGAGVALLLLMTTALAASFRRSRGTK